MHKPSHGQIAQVSLRMKQVHFCKHSTCNTIINYGSIVVAFLTAFEIALNVNIHVYPMLYDTAACPSFNINYPPMRTLLCPGDIITYTCTFSSNLVTVNTQWTGSGFHCSTPGSPANTIVLTQTKDTSLNTVPGSCGNLSAVMTNISGTCYTSVLTIPTPQYFNGTTVMCRDGNFGTLIGNDTLNIQMACKLHVVKLNKKLCWRYFTLI